MRVCIKLTTTIIIILMSFSCKTDKGINRYDLVSRHNIENSIIDSLNSFSVGNGTFTFTVDVTGLQTFPGFYERGISLGTMSDWGWHSFPNPENYNLEDNYRNYDVHGRLVS